MTTITRRRLLLAGIGSLGVSTAGCLGRSGSSEETPRFDTATVHLDPSCGCCKIHANYLREAGVDVETIEHPDDDLSAVKNGYNIPPEYRSCHTTELADGSVIEGHVPISVMNDVVDRDQSISVVSLPGMPSGSPGMPGSKDDEWVFYAIDDDGESEVFTRQ